MPSTEISKFYSVVDKITLTGLMYHKKNLLDHARLNLPDVKKSIKDLPLLQGKKAASGIVISAGPSIHRRKSIKKINESGYTGTTVAVDGSYINSLKNGLIPDFVVTLDPHPTRMVRWFGDHEFEKNSAHDDYFARQDLDIEFRKNTIEQNKRHIALVNEHGHKTKAIVSTTAPRNLVQRLKEGGFDMYWWNPLVDDPNTPGSITREMFNMNRLPCMNTGGTVGTAAWVFANSILKLPQIALTGTDLGYYADLPIAETSTYYELFQHMEKGDSIESYFVDFEYPSTKEIFYTDPTYFWYRKNFLELISLSNGKLYNCTEGGTLYDDQKIECINLDEFLKLHP